MKRRRKSMTVLDYMRQNIKWGMLAFALIFIIGIFIGPGFGSYGSMQCGKSKEPATPQERMKAYSPVLAKLGSEEIKEYMIGRELDQRLEYFKSQSVKGSLIPPEDMLGLRWSVLDSNLENKVKILKATEEGIKVDNEEVDKQFNDYKKSVISQKPSETRKNMSIPQRIDSYVENRRIEREFVTRLQQVGMTPEQLRLDIRDGLLVKKFDEKLDKEAKDEVKAEAKKKAITIYNRIVTDKEDFNKIAKSENDDSSSAAKEGLVENMTRKDAKSKNDAFVTALFTGEIGKVQEPIETEDGFYIVKVENRILAEGPDYEKAKPGIVADLKKELGIKDEQPKEEKKEEPGDAKTKTNEKTDAPRDAQAKNPETKDASVKDAESKDTQAKNPDSAEKKDEKKITDDMIKERYEKATFRQIFVRLPSSYERVNEKVKKIKEEAGFEIVEPMLKAYSYVAVTREDKNYDKAIEEFRAIRDTNKTELEKVKAELADKNSKLASASENQKYSFEIEVSTAEDKVLSAKTVLAQTDYLIAHFMKAKIDDAIQKRLQEFSDKKNKEPEKYKDATAPEATPEEQQKITEAKTEIRTLLEEAVSLLDTPEPYYNAMLGTIYVEDKEWDKAYDQWSIVVDYVVSDPSLLQQANSAYNSFMDNIKDPAKREKAGKELDTLTKNLEKATTEQKKLQEEQQKRWQEMIQEQMKKQEEEKSSKDTPTEGAGDTKAEK